MFILWNISTNRLHACPGVQAHTGKTKQKPIIFAIFPLYNFSIIKKGTHGTILHSVIWSNKVSVDWKICDILITTCCCYGRFVAIRPNGRSNNNIKKCGEKQECFFSRKMCKPYILIGSFQIFFDFFGINNAKLWNLPADFVWMD